MKSKAQVIKEHPELKTLINALFHGLSGTDNISNVNNYGIGGGYGTFIYYQDTFSFYKRYRKTINKLAIDFANEMGQDAISFVGSFKCINNESAEDKNDIGVCLFGGNIEKLANKFHVPNGLAWFAAEEVCRMFED